MMQRNYKVQRNFVKLKLEALSQRSNNQLLSTTDLGPEENHNNTANVRGK